MNTTNSSGAQHTITGYRTPFVNDNDNRTVYTLPGPSINWMSAVILTMTRVGLMHSCRSLPVTRALVGSQLEYKESLTYFLVAIPI